MNELIKNIGQLHTTELGAQRIRKNMRTEAADVVTLCKCYISMPDAKFELAGKNWYIESNNFMFTVNAKSFTIITVKSADKFRKKFLPLNDKCKEIT